MFKDDALTQARKSYALPHDFLHIIFGLAPREPKEHLI